MIDPQALFRFAPEILMHDDEVAARRRGYRSTWRVPDTLPYFNGHFPGTPILPAVAILDATGEMIRQSLSLETLVLTGVKSAKFTSPVPPGMALEITIHELSEKEWQAEWRDADRPKDRSSVALLVVRI